MRNKKKKLFNIRHHRNEEKRKMKNRISTRKNRILVVQFEHGVLHSTLQYSKVQYSNTVHYKTVLYRAVQYIIEKYST